MLPNTVTFALAAANAANIIASNTPAGAGALTLVSPTTIVTTQPIASGTLAVISTPTVTLDAARRVLVTYGNEASTRTVRITGGDRYGNPITETVTVPSGGAGTVATAQDFLTITQVYVFAAFTQAMSVGTNATGSTPWIFAQSNLTPNNFGLIFVVSGTVTGQIDVTLQNPNLPLPGGLIVPDFFQPSGLTSITTTSNGSITTPFTAFRLTITAGTGSIRMSTVQAGNRQS
jgi:hypothetical protein